MTPRAVRGSSTTAANEAPARLRLWPRARGTGASQEGPGAGHTTIMPSVQRPRMMFSAGLCIDPEPNHAIASVANHVMTIARSLPRIIPASVLRQIIVQQRRQKEAAQHGQDDDGESRRFRAPHRRERRRGQRRQRQQHHGGDSELEEIHTPSIGGCESSIGSVRYAYSCPTDCAPMASDPTT